MDFGAALGRLQNGTAWKRSAFRAKVVIRKNCGQRRGGRTFNEANGEAVRRALLVCAEREAKEVIRRIGG
jgi:hypothetical protein